MQKSQYSEEDRLEFRRKDLRISKISMLQTSGNIFAAAIEVGLRKKMPSVGDITGLADKLVAWVYEDLDGNGIDKAEVVIATSPIVTNNKLSQPTAQEAKVLAEVMKLYADENTDASMIIDGTKVRVAILNKYDKYPTNVESAAKVVGEIPLSEVVSSNSFIQGLD